MTSDSSFIIRCQLDGKQGMLYVNNTLRHFRLSWPSLEISESPTFESSEQFPVRECSFFPLPSGDRIVHGIQGFCISVKNNRTSTVHEWFATVSRYKNNTFAKDKDSLVLL